MKYALITAIATLGFASGAVAQDTFVNDTVMTRNVSATSILSPRDAAQSKGGYVRVTIGEHLVENAGDLLNPREAAIAEDGTANSYVFSGSFADTVKGGYSYR